MKDNADTLLAGMDRLLGLAELARCAAPEDRARIDRTIDLVGRALLAVAQARDAAERAQRRRERADAALVDRQGELAALLTELRIMMEDIPR